MAHDQYSPTEVDDALMTPERPFGREIALSATLHEVFAIGDKPRPMIARYAIERRLGTGGMSEVFLANDPELRRQVAIKVLNQRFATGEQRHLLREAWTLASVDHPNIVAVYDVGFENGRAFLVMEHLAGETFDRWLGSRQRPLAAILHTLLPLCEGLATVHERGIVHRDLKPQNIIIGPKHTAKVIDFGLVVGSGLEYTPKSEARPSSLPIRARQGQGERLIGTPTYMSPEHALGLKLDGRSDQFSLAIVIYEAVFGARPFTGRGASLIYAITELPPKRPRRLRWRERLLWKVLRRALAKDPTARYPDMGVFTAALRRVIDGPKRVGQWIALGIILSAAVLLGITMPPQLHYQMCLGKVENAWLTPGRLPEGPLRVRLTTYADSWSAAWTRDCELAHRQGLLTVDVGLPQRQACLQEIKAVVEEALRRLPSEDLDAHNQLLRAELPALSACEAGPPIRDQRPPPLDEIDSIADVAASIQTANAQYLLGRIGDAEQRARAAVVQAAKVHHRETRAQASFALGRILRHAEASGEEAMNLLIGAANDAIAGRNRLLALWALHEAARAALLLNNNPTIARKLLDRAEAELSALYDLPPTSATQLWASHHDIRGLIFFSTGAIRASETAHRRAIDRLQNSDNLDDQGTRLLAAAYLNLSRTLDKEGPRSNALDRAYALETALYGSEHRSIAAILHSQALAAARAGHRLQARSLAEEALLLLNREHDPGVKRQRASTELLLSEILLQAGHYATALRLAVDAESICNKYDKGHGLELLQARRLKASSLRSLGRHDDAALVEAKLTEQCHSDEALAVDDIVDILLDLAKGKIDEGRANKALDILNDLEGQLSDDDPHAPSLDMVRGWALADMAHSADAIFSLEKGIAAAHPGNQDAERARSQWILAEVLISTGGKRLRICELLAACRNFYVAEEATPALLGELAKLEGSQGCVPTTPQRTDPSK